jgi:hypothetical protein
MTTKTPDEFLSIPAVQRALEDFYTAVALYSCLPRRKSAGAPRRDRRLAAAAALTAERIQAEGKYNPAVAIASELNRRLEGEPLVSAVRRVQHYIADGRRDEENIRRLLRGGPQLEQWERDDYLSGEGCLGRFCWFMARALTMFAEQEARARTLFPERKAVVNTVGRRTAKERVERGNTGKARTPRKTAPTRG